MKASHIEQNNELYPAVVAGDPAAREALIVGNMPLIVVKVDAFIRYIPSVAYLRDDLVSAGYIALVKAVNNIAKGKVEMKAVNAYIGRVVRLSLGHLIDDEHSVRVPRETDRRRRNNGRQIRLPAIVNIIPETVETPSPFAALEMRDLLDACCDCDEERACLRLREEGHTFQEMARSLEMPLSSAYVMFREVQARFFARLEEDE